MSDLHGKRVLVTGAGRGAGFGIARAFAAAGAEVIATSRSEAGLNRLKQTIEGEGGRMALVPGDLSTRAGARDIAARAGKVDVLVNNAAYVDGKQHSVVVADDAGWDLELAVNLIAPVVLVQALVPGMIARGGGAVINISSIAVVRPNPTHAAYAASKAALETFTRAAAVDLGSSGVRVNAIALGVTATEAWDHLLPQGMTLDQMAARVAPLRRPVDVAEVGAMCVYLASDAAAAITGSVITIDGGATAGVYNG